MSNRHSRYQESDLRAENLVRKVDLITLKRQWLYARERAQSLFDLLPPEEIGCLYLRRNNNPVTPNPASPDFPKLDRHLSTHCGAWPTFVDA